MKNKSGPEAAKAFESILSTKIGGRLRVPRKLQTDKGGEYLNKNFQNLLKKKKIKFLLRKIMTLKRRSANGSIER